MSEYEDCFYISVDGEIVCIMHSPEFAFSHLVPIPDSFFLPRCENCGRFLDQVKETTNGRTDTEYMWFGDHFSPVAESIDDDDYEFICYYCDHYPGDDAAEFFMDHQRDSEE